jgi:PLP dependent protein
VALIAVSKTQTPESIIELAQLGQRQFAENYLQEALSKIEVLNRSVHALTWHFIGPIQSNKTQAIAQNFSWVHSVDRLKIAQRLSDQRPVDLPPLQICLQVNTSLEDQKSGLPAAHVLELAKQIALLPRLCLRGLMCIPRPSDLADPREDFQAMRDLLAELRLALPPQDAVQLDTLSMGMSADLQIAIAAGATMVRVGTALFGARS